MRGRWSRSAVLAGLRALMWGATAAAAPDIYAAVPVTQDVVAPALAAPELASPGKSGSEAGVRIADIAADPPTDVAVTVYRAPFRNSGSIDLDELEGFALIRETRRVSIPSGESRIRFEGVADGIEAVSALVSGLPPGLLERNLDADLLSPEALMAAASGKALVLVRTNPRTGRSERIPVTVVSGANGVVFHTSEGFEAFDCSGLSDHFNFTGITGLSASPTLSVRMRAAEPSTRVVTLSYLARGFDWSADYSATLSQDGKRLGLGAWITLANSNGIGFPSARVQVVAGRLNRERNAVEPFDIGGEFIAQCWPQGSTSDVVQLLQRERALPDKESRFDVALPPPPPPSPVALADIVVTASVKQEQLGDLKLYRVPDRTTVASRQSKQVRLLDRQGIPVQRIYTATLRADDADEDYQASSALLRTRNDAAHHLGLPLPSGRISVFGVRGAEPLLLSESAIRDTAVNEEVEIDLGPADDVLVRSLPEETQVNPARARIIPLVPGVVSVRDAQVNDAMRVEVSNAGSSAIQFELSLRLEEGARIIRADHPLGTKNGQPVFRLAIPANRTVVVRYRTQTHRVQGVPR